MAKIMLVEDDNNLREIYEARLMAEGYEIVTARDGEEALAVAVREKPDLIISDVMMPKISGFDMLDILRSTPETKNTKVIMMTALSQAEDKARAEKLGADRYLVKSQVTLEDVAKVARDVLAGEGAAGAPPVDPGAPVAAAAAPEPASAVPPVAAAPATAPVSEATAGVVADAAQTAPATAAPAPAAPAEPVPATPVATTPTVAAIQMTPSLAAPAPAPVPEVEGITDLESLVSPANVAAPAATAAPVSIPITDAAPVIQPAVSSEPAIEIEKTSNEQWSAAATTAAPAPAQDQNDIAAKAAAAKLAAVTPQSLADEEAAIAKQIESVMQATPAAPATEVAAAPAPAPAAPAAAPAPAVTPAPAAIAPPSTRSTVGEKVIQPLNDITASKGPDLQELARKEAEKEAAAAAAAQAPVAPAAPAAAPAPAAPTAPAAAGGIDPNSLAL